MSKNNRNNNRHDNRDRNRNRDREQEQEEVNPLIVYGRNAVIEGIKSGRSVDKIFVQKTEHLEGSATKIVSMAKDLNIQVKYADHEKLDQLTDRGKHQGVVAFMAAHDYVELDDLLKSIEDKGEAPFLILLDQIEDPHNLGAIIRSANIVGAHGVIIPKNRAVSLTATVAKTSAGAIEYTPVCRVTNLARTIDTLKEKGIWITGADMDGTSMYDVDLKGSIGLVIGSEGKGVSRLVREKCDFIASIPMKGQVNSLNASVAAGVLMFEALRQRQ